MYLEYIKTGSKQQKAIDSRSATVISDEKSQNWGAHIQQLQTSHQTVFTFDLPEPWEASISDYTPPGPPPVYPGYCIEIKHPQKEVKLEWFSPLKFHFYLGDLGEYLKQQRKPITPRIALQSFFEHALDSCQRIAEPYEDWKRPKSQTAEYYSEVQSDWFRVEGLTNPTYYYIKIEKAPTPGVYGDLGSWTLSAFRFTLAEGVDLSETFMKVAQTFYKTVEKKQLRDSAVKS